jgi:hypothetical protein
VSVLEGTISSSLAWHSSLLLNLDALIEQKKQQLFDLTSKLNMFEGSGDSKEADPKSVNRRTSSVFLFDRGDKEKKNKREKKEQEKLQELIEKESVNSGESKVSKQRVHKQASCKCRYTTTKKDVQKNSKRK